MSDDLAEIDGVKPNTLLMDGQEMEVGSKTSSSKYKCKRTIDHYYCTCPAWRNQSGVPVNARTCKHLKELLGEPYEAVRVKMRLRVANSSSSNDLKSTLPTPSNRKRKKGSSDHEDARGTNEKPTKVPKTSASTRPRKNASSVKADSTNPTDAPPSQIATPSEPRGPHDHTEDVPMNDVEGEHLPTAQDPKDELSVINGVKPQVIMKDGDEIEVSSQTSSSKYKIKRTWDHYYCTCPAWRNQGGVPVNTRSCKHLKQLLGDAYEAERMNLKNPGANPGTGESRTAKSTRSTAPSSTKAPQLLLANKWDIETGLDPTGWWISEKFDGVRAFWDGKQFLSRLGNPFSAPQWFLDKFPSNVTLDGELWGGRQGFQDTISIVKTANSPHWKGITFQVFDIPSVGTLPFETRVQKLHSLFSPGPSQKGTHACPEIAVANQEEAISRQHVLDKLKQVEQLGGEGLMLRKAQSQYEGRRSATLLKVKTFFDAEAEVIDYESGKGKNQGVVGALVCIMESGKKFKVGTGLSDKQRRNPPKKGAIIVYRFQELTKSGVPRFPSYQGEAVDKIKPKDADVPAHRRGDGSNEDR